MPTIKTDLCILGAGSGGLSVAAGAAQMGANVVLIEPHKMGGDCLNYGCVPSKALISAAKRFYDIQHSAVFGIDNASATVNYSRVQQYVKNVIASIAPHDSVERFEGLGVHVIQGAPHFIDNKTVMVNDQRICARKFVIATGSSAAIPTVPGIEHTPYLTNETIFDLTELPTHLLIIGGGPIGCELGQAFAMFGSKVSIIQRREILAKEDSDTREIIRQDLINTGVELYEHTDIHHMKQTNEGVEISLQQNKKNITLTGTHLLIAAGRQPNLHNLKLEKADVNYSAKGIDVDTRCRTNQKHIYAIGDVTGEYQFTHAANYHAGIVIRNSLFRLPSKKNYSALPWVTYTRLELAHVGLNETAAKQQGIQYTKTTLPMDAIDRAKAQQSTEGFIKVLTNKKGYVIGATLVGEQAGELLMPWIMAIQQRMKIKKMTEIIAPYPTLSEINKRVAGQYFIPMITSSFTKRLVRWLK